ncbi:transcriptional regulator, LuxR family domain protein [Mycobacterium xenopi 4042]|uniref:Transcriptional regulator, LuxR family domain protein n=1 Tax=Mycobacterium xenopi 4042 TaxID=1299334 RepID=X8BFE0_MYCXE|nr:transcriptional regulator, LuxR family domain protein [Mycobacterium xenopi 4042]
MISGDPLTGREGELKLIRRALSGFGNYSGVIIAGPPVWARLGSHERYWLARPRQVPAPTGLWAPSLPDRCRWAHSPLCLPTRWLSRCSVCGG